MRKLHSSIKDRFGFYAGFGLQLQEFLAIETVLTVMREVAPDADPQKAYLLLSGYYMIAGKDFDENDFLLQNLKRGLRQYKSKKLWQDRFCDYLGEAYRAVRLYDLDSAGKLVLNPNEKLPYKTRAADYLNCVKNFKRPVSSLPTAQNGTYYYFVKETSSNREEKAVRYTVEFGAFAKTEKELSRQKPARPGITVPMADILATAKDMSGIDPVCKKVLSANRFLCAKGGDPRPAQSIEIDGLTNVVGMVGAGKSTFIKALTVHLCRKGYRLVIVTDTVTDVFRLTGYFGQFGIDCAPLIGRSERVKYVRQICAEGEMYLDPEISQYLTGACIVDGTQTGCDIGVSFGEEPCFFLRKNNGTYVCPHYGDCPCTLMQRRAAAASLVVTTDAGFVKTKIGRARRLFLEEVLDSVDLVIYDESDRVQKKFDETFTPAVMFNKFNQENSPELKQYLEKKTKERLDDRARDYRELQLIAPNILSAVADAFETNLGKWKETAMSETFSALSLMDHMLEKNHIPQALYDELYQTIDNKAEDRNLCIAYKLSCDKQHDDLFRIHFDAWLNKFEINQQNTTVIKNQIKLILKLIYFDEFVRDLEDTYNDIEEGEPGKTELFNFLRSRFKLQQDYLPSAPTGNLFGFKLGDDTELILYRQYAYGRALLTDLAGAKLDCDGSKCGPHTLLLSGSSWAPGAFEYHVNAPVDYIIEAEESKRSILERAKVSDLGIVERVSGSMRDRQENLKKVTEKTMSAVLAELNQGEGKALLIVNSYDEAKAVRRTVEKLLEKREERYRVAAMISDRDLSENDAVRFIRRGEIYRFETHPAHILVAPAVAIERGHNIVDERGHSTINSVFFLVRPMSVPDDISQKGMKLNGYIAALAAEKSFSSFFEKADFIRGESTKRWKVINLGMTKNIENLPADMKTDVTATLFIVIMQIFGRLARITDETKKPPSVYFADGAFGPRETPGSYNAIADMKVYLGGLMTHPQYGEIAKTLYGPFYKALEGGLINV